jgi:hypothetical protein
MLPGRIISVVGAVRLGSTTETDGTAICAVTVRKVDEALTRERIPEMKSPAMTITTTKGISQRLNFPPL